MDKKSAKIIFDEYTSRYDTSDVMITLKIYHTYRVANIAERITKSLCENEQEASFGWFLGLLHDVGRFEQYKKYKTFVDRDSVDHAELGADILFNEGLIDSFDTKDLFDGWKEIAELAVRLHNKLNVPEDLDEKTALYVNILRDADKCDIFRVLTEPPYDKRNDRVVTEAKPVRDNVMNCVYEHRCVPRTGKRTEFENLMSQCCMAFELNYSESRKIVKEQGYLDKLLSVKLENKEAGEQMSILKNELRVVFDLL